MAFHTTLLCGVLYFSLNWFSLGHGPIRGRLPLVNNSAVPSSEAPAQTERRLAKDRAPRGAISVGIIPRVKSEITVINTPTCGSCRVLKAKIKSWNRVQDKLSKDFIYLERDAGTYNKPPRSVPMLEMRNRRDGRWQYVKPPFEENKFLLMLERWA